MFHKSSEYSVYYFITFGILLISPLVIFLYSYSIPIAINGGFNAAISYITHPKDQISLLKSYGKFYQTSGAQ